MEDGWARCYCLKRGKRFTEGEEALREMVQEWVPRKKKKVRNLGESANTEVRVRRGILRGGETSMGKVWQGPSFFARDLSRAG